MASHSLHCSVEAPIDGVVQAWPIYPEVFTEIQPRPKSLEHALLGRPDHRHPRYTAGKGFHFIGMQKARGDAHDLIPFAFDVDAYGLIPYACRGPATGRPCVVGDAEVPFGLLRQVGLAIGIVVNGCVGKPELSHGLVDAPMFQLPVRRHPHHIAMRKPGLGLGPIRQCRGGDLAKARDGFRCQTFENHFETGH